MNDKQLFDWLTRGFDGLARIVRLLESANYCMIGTNAFNCYQGPLFAYEAEFVIAASDKRAVLAALRKNGFKVKSAGTELLLQVPDSALTVLISTDEARQEFLGRAKVMPLFDALPVRTACVEDLVRDKVRALTVPGLPPHARDTDKLLLMMAMSNFPKTRKLIPAPLRKQLKS